MFSKICINILTFQYQHMIPHNRTITTSMQSLQFSSANNAPVGKIHFTGVSRVKVDLQPFMSNFTVHRMFIKSKTFAAFLVQPSTNCMAPGHHLIVFTFPIAMNSFSTATSILVLNRLSRIDSINNVLVIIKYVYSNIETLHEQFTEYVFQVGGTLNVFSKTESLGCNCRPNNLFNFSSLPGQN